MCTLRGVRRQPPPPTPQPPTCLLRAASFLGVKPVVSPPESVLRGRNVELCKNVSLSSLKCRLFKVATGQGSPILVMIHLNSPHVATDPQWVPMTSDFNSHWSIMSSYLTMWMLLWQRGVVQNKPFLKINSPINAIYCLFLSKHLKYSSWKNSQELNFLCNPAPIICYKVGQPYPRVWLAGLFSSCLDSSAPA